MRKIFLVILSAGLLMCGCSTSKHQIKVHESELADISKISVIEVKEIINHYDDHEDVYIIDVRSEDEFKEGHIEGAINIPLDILENIDIPKEKKIIVYCHSGRRSNLAANTLKKLGYENVFDMGGINDWPYDIVK